MSNLWKNCNACKKPISLGGVYYVCSVSSCNGKRTGLVFCSVPCFDRHVPIARHKDAAAVEMKAPMVAETARIIASSGPRPSTPATSSNDVLIIASRLKEYITAQSDYNTSGGVMDVLSDYVRILCDRAIDNARAEGRRTVMERDFDFLRNLR